MTYLDPYINFLGNCNEAMKFYVDCFDAKLEVMRVGDSPMAKDMPADTHNQVLHSRLSLDNHTLFLASDALGREVSQGENVSLCYSGDLDKVKNAFSKLSEGGKILHEFKEEFFGAYGELVDKFGISWKFQSDQKPQ